MPTRVRVQLGEAHVDDALGADEAERGAVAAAVLEVGRRARA